MIIICNNMGEYDKVKKDLYRVSEDIEVLAVGNGQSYVYYSPGDHNAKSTCTFDLVKSKIGIAHWFCTLQTLLDTIKKHFEEPEESTVEISMDDIAKAFDIPVKAIKIVD
jgi:hypothetical protein